MPFKFEATRIPEVIVIQPTIFQDDRGFFLETYKQSEFMALGMSAPFIQGNHSRSTQGVLRGLHYQKPPKAQGKLLRVIQGEIFDAAVDIRHGSPTFGQWVGVILSAENKKMFYVPTGFAHGFCVITKTAEVLYQTTEEYFPQHEAGILWNDPDIAIEWPVQNPTISGKDSHLPRLKECQETGFAYRPSQ